MSTDLKFNSPLSQLNIAGGIASAQALTDVARTLGGLEASTKLAEQTLSTLTKIPNIGGIADPRVFRTFPFESAAETALKEQIASLRVDLKKADSAFQKSRADSKTAKEENERLNATVKALIKQQQLLHVLSRVHESAHDLIRSSDEFAEKFTHGKTCFAFVVSVDIRRSTELMLHAREPEMFANFISTLVDVLSGDAKAELGAVDKFTGDGLLVFFPDFYSGDDMGARAMRFAQKCHAAFEKIYREHWNSFDIVLDDIGLGIGIDAGDVKIVRVPDGISVIGKAVVFACRLGGAPAGRTFINRNARVHLTERYQHSVVLDEVRHEIKNQGPIVVSQLNRFQGENFAAAPWQIEGGGQVNAETDTQIHS